MTIIEILKNIDDKELVKFIKYELKVQLEDVNFAEYNDVKDLIVSKKFNDNNYEFVFSSDDKSNAIKFYGREFDYKIVKFEFPEYNAPKFYDYETFEQHQNGRKAYINFVGEHIGSYSKQAQDEYLRRANSMLVEEQVNEL